MAQRYGCNQKRAAREKIAALESQVRVCEARLYLAEKKARDFDAKEMLVARIAGKLGPEVAPYIIRMMVGDVRGRAHQVLNIKETYMPMTGMRRFHAVFDLHAIIEIEDD